MELPRRNRGDELLRPGELLALRERLRRVAPQHDIATVIACAFDFRTNMLPFIYASTRMAPAGSRAIGSAMLDAGFEKTRIVLTQWNRNFRPSKMRLDGRIPDVFMVSSMQIHFASCERMLRDAWLIDPEHRPLIIAGGPKANYEPWDCFGIDPQCPWGADVAVTGEEFVLLSLLEAILSVRAKNEPMRVAFGRARDMGLLDDIPGLVYPRGDRPGVAHELVDTGVQRLLGDLDELPSPVLGYRILEPPSNAETMTSKPLPPELVGRYSPISSLVLTFGCKFACTYCPIPAYNQRQHRLKSGERIAEEFVQLYKTYGLHRFFGSDDNFFNHKARTLEICETLAKVEIDGQPIRKKIRWGTEVTVHDTLLMKEHLPVVRKSGVRALWLGVEDMTATLVKKGQSVGKTVEAFRVLNENGICPMPMMMHHDEQPLVSRGEKPYGLINQVRILRQAGAVSMQILMLVPATGSKLYGGTYTSGMAYESVGGRVVDEHMLGGNYVVASNHPKPWIKQLNIYAGYLYFYNPLRWAWALVKPKSKLYLVDAIAQTIGMLGLWQTIRHTLGWTFRLRFGKIKRMTAPPTARIPMRSPRGEAADHALPVVQVGTWSPEPAAAEKRTGREMALPVLAAD
jgi:radical SAM superfamily enzyme YgiQ (UPF0313 family)